ncbi:MAG TPA: S-layer homology domain-containing protein [Clostridia bacterium]|nr:S-layer homology domain-containing protein [Clostridia bacterium]
MKRGVTILICFVMLMFMCLAVSAEDLPMPKSPLKPAVPTTPALPDSGIMPSKPAVTAPALPDTKIPDIKTPDTVQPVESFEAPSELEAQKIEYNLVSIRWKDNSTAETEFVVERKISDGNYVQLAVLGQNITTYEDTSVEPGTAYYYRVKAGKNDSGFTRIKKVVYSDYSDEVMVDTPAAPSPPVRKLEPDIKTPGDIQFPIIETEPEIKPEVKPETEPEVKPEVKPETEPEDTSETTPEITPEDTSETTPEVIPEDTSETIPEITPETTSESEEENGYEVGINAPGALETTEVNGNEIVLSWEDKSDNEEGFLLYKASTGEWEEAAALDADTTTYSDKKVQPDTTYYYVLFAYKGDNVSSQSNLVEIKTPEAEAATAANTAAELAAPQNLSAKAQNPSEVLLTWEDKSDNEEGFLIYKASAGEWKEAAKLNADVTAYTDKAVMPGTKYYYIVYAYAGNIASPESNLAEITTPDQEASTAAADFAGASSWAVEELAKAVEYGLYTDKIMKNYSQSITREEFCELVIKLYEKLKGTEAIPVSPNPFRDTANGNILKAFGAGIVKGTGADTFSPYNPITRQDICVMFYRAITGAVANVETSIEGAPTFADENLIGSWAIKEVKYAYKNNIMKGAGANKILPKDNTSREQALILVKRAYEAFAGR